MLKVRYKITHRLESLFLHFRRAPAINESTSFYRLVVNKKFTLILETPRS
jgi:hypothetical protein